jgi:hypothetical protein
MLNAEAIAREINFIIRNSLFDIRYSFGAYGELIVLELPTAKELAKHLRFANNIRHTTHYRLPTAFNFEKQSSRCRKV